MTSRRAAHRRWAEQGLLVAVFLLAGGASPLAGAAALGPELLPRAFWVDSTVCTVLVKAPIDTTKPLQTGTPVDLLASLPAICTSSVTGQALVPGGVRSLLVAGFRVTAVSHTVSPLPAAAGDSRVDLLISAIFSLERPQSTATPAR